MIALIAMAAAASQAAPIIDMHMHTSRGRPEKPEYFCTGDELADYPVPDPTAPICAHPLRSASNGQEMLQKTLDQFRRYEVRHAVLAGPLPLVGEWKAAYQDIFIPAADFPGLPRRGPEELRKLFAEGRFAVFAEVGSQYGGVRADDPQLEPYWALAEELDIPVGIHLGAAIPDAQQVPGLERYRASLTSPFQLEEVLIRHPRLKVYAMHYAAPLVDEMIAMLTSYTNLYVDIAANDWNIPRAQFYEHLKRLTDAGFSKRIMFGSDPGPYPESIGKAIASVRDAPFLSEEQKRDILYNNAARFLRLSPEQIARDHGRAR